MIKSSVNLLARINLPMHQFSLLKSVVLGHEFNKNEQRGFRKFNAILSKDEPFRHFFPVNVQPSV